jgi:indolepyruvate ferredoxin oxidoreductase beta subunit
MEALRFAHYLKPGGAALVNAQEILPPSVTMGKEPYPARIEDRLKGFTPNLFVVDALAAALSLHEVRAVNIVMVGAASRFLPLAEEAYIEALRAALPGKIVEVNVKAFRAGRGLLPAAGT